MTYTGEKVAGILLAAGASTRMGRPKQLLPVRHKTLLGRVLEESLQSDLDKIILVLGHQADDIRHSLGKLLRHPDLKIVENRRYHKGISTSIMAGLTEVEAIYDNVMILLGDMPYIDTCLINLLIQKFLDSTLPLGAVRIKSRRSHPVIFNKKLYGELHGLRGDVGAKGLFRKYGERVLLVDPEVPYDDRDIDTPENYTEFKKTLKDR